jgi:hypothetical protein
LIEGVAQTEKSNAPISKILLEDHISSIAAIHLFASDLFAIRD